MYFFEFKKIEEDQNKTKTQRTKRKSRTLLWKNKYIIQTDAILTTLIKIEKSQKSSSKSN